MKNAIIFGDSYSTYEGFVPEGYAIYYPRLDVNSVNETWWSLVAKEKNLNIVMNNSWSGSTMCYTAYDNVDCSKSSSFIFRLRQLKEKNFFEENKIDTAFVFGGTNDSWSNAPLGEVKEKYSEKDLFEVIPAVYHFLESLRDAMPQGDIYCLVNTELKKEIADALINASKQYGITPVTFEDIRKDCGHPTAAGMKDIANKVNEMMNKHLPE